MQYQKANKCFENMFDKFIKTIDKHLFLFYNINHAEHLFAHELIWDIIGGYDMNEKRICTGNRRKHQVLMQKSALFIVVTVIVLLANIIFGSFSANAHGNSTEDPVSFKYYKSIEINKGDTLWSIAKNQTDGTSSEIIAYIKELKSINSLHTDDIHAGNFITISYYDNEFK